MRKSVPIGYYEEKLSVCNIITVFRKMFNSKHQNDIGTRQVLIGKLVSMCDTLY